jgi:tetratricopeptide (TPR) repeat protein
MQEVFNEANQSYHAYYSCEKDQLYYSYFQIARCKRLLNYPEHEWVHAFLECCEIKPNQAEAFYELARYYRIKQKYRLGYLYAKAGAAIEAPPKDTNFVDSSVYTHKLKDELSICAYWIGQYEEALSLTHWLLDSPYFAGEERDRLNANLKFSQDKLFKS